MLSKESAKTLKTIDFLLHGCHLQTREVRRETPSIIDQINTQLVLFFHHPNTVFFRELCGSRRDVGIAIELMMRLRYIVIPLSSSSSPLRPARKYRFVIRSSSLSVSLPPSLSLSHSHPLFFELPLSCLTYSSRALKHACFTDCHAVFVASAHDVKL